MARGLEGLLGRRRRQRSAARNLLTAVIIGLLAGAAVTALAGPVYGVVAAWLAAATVYLLATWLVIRRMDAATTARDATREDPTRGAAHAALLIASIGSLGGVGLLLVSTGRGQGLIVAVLGVLSVAASWLTVHTIYTLGYAARYYDGDDGGIDFNQKAPPAYPDFAYLGFTLGMTYQVSDTSVGDPVIRRMVLRHALLSYVLGAVVLGIAINLIGSLAS